VTDTGKPPVSWIDKDESGHDNFNNWREANDIKIQTTAREEGEQGCFRGTSLGIQAVYGQASPGPLSFLLA
jgi:hypothetical protein